MTLDRYAERINDVLSRCRSKSPVLVNHSLAGVGIARALELHLRSLERLGGSLGLIAAGHDAMLSATAQLAECLIEQCRNADGDEAGTSRDGSSPSGSH